MTGYRPISYADLPASVPGHVANIICRRMAWDDIAAALAYAPPRERLAAEMSWSQMKAAQRAYLEHRRGELEPVEAVPDPDAALLSTAEAAEAAGVTPRTMRRWHRDGLVAGAMRSGALYLDAASLGEYLRKRAASPEADSGQDAPA